MDTIGIQETRLAGADVFYSRRFHARRRAADPLRRDPRLGDRSADADEQPAADYFPLTPPGLSAGTLPQSGIKPFADSRRFTRLYDGGATAAYVLSGARVT